jgi:hypothetical protein
MNKVNLVGKIVGIGLNKRKRMINSIIDMQSIMTKWEELLSGVSATKRNNQDRHKEIVE